MGTDASRKDVESPEKTEKMGQGANRKDVKSQKRRKEMGPEVWGKEIDKRSMLVPEAWRGKL